ncbi:hypothetical protein Bca4012_073735 [Brassica carinata]
MYVLGDLRHLPYCQCMKVNKTLFHSPIIYDQIQDPELKQFIQKWLSARELLLNPFLQPSCHIVFVMPKEGANGGRCLASEGQPTTHSRPIVYRPRRRR